VFDSFRRVLGEEIYLHRHPAWSAMQAAAVERVCRDEAMPTWGADQTAGQWSSSRSCTTGRRTSPAAARSR
jgi:hypothetical protein